MSDALVQVRVLEHELGARQSDGFLGGVDVRFASSASLRSSNPFGGLRHSHDDRREPLARVLAQLGQRLSRLVGHRRCRCCPRRTRHRSRPAAGPCRLDRTAFGRGRADRADETGESGNAVHGRFAAGSLSIASTISRCVCSSIPDATRKSFGTGVRNRDEQETRVRSGSSFSNFFLVPSHTAARSAFRRGDLAERARCCSSRRSARPRIGVRSRVERLSSSRTRRAP